MQEPINHFLSCYTAEKLSVWKLTSLSLSLTHTHTLTLSLSLVYVTLLSLEDDSVSGLETRSCCELERVCDLWVL